MKRVGYLWDKVVSWENLILAAKKAQRGKRDRPVVQEFNFAQEQQLLKLKRELEHGTYQPGGFTTHWIYRPKARLISAAPYRDRVVHHAIMNVLEPILDNHFHPDSFACRKDKGTHAAVKRLQRLMKKSKYALQLDIRKFFPSIDHEILKHLFRSKIKDSRVLRLMDLIVDSSNPQEPVLHWFAGDDLFVPFERLKGLPIGNLTSQWFANWYLNNLDYFITHVLQIGSYVRYCDDFILLGNNRYQLSDALLKIESFLGTQRRIKLHHKKRAIVSTACGIRFAGYRVWANRILLPKKNIRSFRRRILWMQKAYYAGKITWQDVKIRIDSWLGHAQWANTKMLIKRLSKQWIFRRDRAARRPCSPRRQLEQQSRQLPFSEPQQEHARQPEQQHRLSCCRPALSIDKSGTVRLTDCTGVVLKVLALFRCRGQKAA